MDGRFKEMNSKGKGIAKYVGIAALMGLVSAPALFLQACLAGPTGSVTPPIIPCEDHSFLKQLPRPKGFHKLPIRAAGRAATADDLPGTTWASKAAVRSFFGEKDIKVVFTLKNKLYLVEYTATDSAVTVISRDDEGLDGKLGTINSPLLSPDGKRLVYAGTTRGKPTFMREAVGGATEVLRVPLDPRANVMADPHWHVEGGKTWIYYSTISGLVDFNERCHEVAGNTYRVEIVGEDSVGGAEVTLLPGSYRGGLSKDGLWAGTSYAASTLYDKFRDTTLLLNRGIQQCNPSMNPYPVGSKRSDYMMILGFGGLPYDLVDGTQYTEGLHQNLWIYNRDDKVVWRAPRPDSALYQRYDKPEWSTHPDYAIAVALRKSEIGDLVVVRIGDLADAEEGQVNLAKGFLKIAEGGFTSDSYSHLWVAP